MTQTSRCSSVVEHFLGKEEVKGSIPFNGSLELPDVQMCDATEADSSNVVDYIIIKNCKHNLKTDNDGN